MLSYKLGVVLLTGALVNDLLLIQNAPSTSFAKAMFLLGTVFILITGVKARTLIRSDFAVLLYTAALAFTSTLSPSGLLSEGGAPIAASLGIGLAGHLVFKIVSASHFHLAAKYFVQWSLFGAILGIAQAITGRFYFTDRIFESTFIGGLHRASGLASDPNYFGLICLLALPLIKLSKFQTKVSQKFIAMTLIIGIILSGSRSSLLVLFAYFSIMPILWSRASFTKQAAVTSCVILAFFTAIQLAPDAIKMVFDPSNYNEDAERNSLQDRAIAVITALSVGTQNPIFGYGLGSFRFHPLNIHNQVSHNSYAELFAESGMIGLLAFIALFIYLAKRLNSVNSDTTHARAIISCQIMFMLMSLFLVTHYSRLLFFVTGITSGALIVSRGIDGTHARKNSDEYRNI